MTTALVTGAGGFLGRAVVGRLEALGVAVISLGVAPSAAHRGGHIQVAPPLGALDLARMIEPVQPRVVLSLAAAPPTASRDIHQDVTQGFALALVEAVAATAPAARTITIGSAAEFGALTRQDRPLREDDPCAPQSDYGRAKHAVTLAVHRLSDQGMDIAALRLFAAAGAGAPRHTVLGAAASQLRALPPAGGDVALGALDAWRDYLLVEEAARLIVDLALRPGPLPALVNVASGQALSVARVVAAMMARTPKPCRLVRPPDGARAIGPSLVVGDIARLVGLGITPQAPSPEEIALAVMNGPVPSDGAGIPRRASRDLS